LQIAQAPPDEVLRQLDELLQPEGTLIPVPSVRLRRFDYTHLRVWCHLRAVYGIPTIELVEYLRDLMPTDALEIGAGNGAFGRALGIPRTDSYLQSWPEIRALYAAQQQPVIDYPGDVECLDYVDAIEKYKPQAVFGSWVTHKYDPGNHAAGGNVYGVSWEALLARCPLCVMYGNKAVHQGNPAMKHPKLRRLQAPWMWSRARCPEDNAVFIWDLRE
jgi:hypothetical protein